MAWLQRRLKQSKVWYICTRVDGKIKKKSCKTHDEVLARSILKEFEAYELKRNLEDTFGDFKSIERIEVQTRKKIAIASVVSFWEQYRDSKSWEKKGRKGQGVVLSYYNHFLRWCNNKHSERRYINELNSQIALEYLNGLGCSNNTKNKYLSNLKMLWKTILIPADLDSNIWDKVPRFKIHKEDKIIKLPFNEKQIKLLIDKAPVYFWKIAIKIAMLSGLRFGDICMLQWEELNETNCCIKLDPNKTKEYGTGILFSIPRNIMNELFSLPQTNSFIFPDIAKKYQTVDGIRYFTQLMKECNIDDKNARGQKVLSFHSLRHAFITIAINRGVSKDEVRETVGHTDIIMTDNYNHNLAKTEKIMNKMRDLVEC